jgi:hypothetical protein
MDEIKGINVSMVCPTCKKMMIKGKTPKKRGFKVYK